MSYTTKNSTKKKRAVFTYFELLYTKFLKLVQLNFVYMICILPLILGITYFTCLMLNISAEVIGYSQILTLLVYITELIPIYILVPLFIASAIFYGPLTAGLTFCVRNMVTRKAFWISDLFTKAKSNFKQSLIFGLIDIFVILCCVLYCSMELGEGLNFYNAIKYVAIFVAVLYFFMRFYIYTMVVTFDLSIKNILTNARLFVVLGFFKNLLATLIGAVIAISFISTPIIDIVLFATLYFSLCRFSAVFSTYPVIDEYILRPQKKKTTENETTFK